jgi:Reverse transcriptase (RNA-dependent DNA polymerase)
MVHTAVPLHQESVRTILALAAVLGFNVWTTDIAQAHLQRAEKLHKKIFSSPPLMDLGPDELLQLSRPLYGLSEAGDYWSETLMQHHLHDLRFQQSQTDCCLFFKKLGSRLVGLLWHRIGERRVGLRVHRVRTSRP